MSQVIGYGLALIGWARALVYRLLNNSDPYVPEFADAADEAIALTAPTLWQRLSAIPQGIDCAGIDAEDVEVIRRNRMDMSDDEREAQDVIVAALERQFAPPVPFVPGPYDIAAEGEEQL